MLLFLPRGIFLQIPKYTNPTLTRHIHRKHRTHPTNTQTMPSISHTKKQRLPRRVRRTSQLRRKGVKSRRNLVSVSIQSKGGKLSSPPRRRGRGRVSRRRRGGGNIEVVKQSLDLDLTHYCAMINGQLTQEEYNTVQSFLNSNPKLCTNPNTQAIEHSASTYFPDTYFLPYFKTMTQQVHYIVQNEICVAFAIVQTANAESKNYLELQLLCSSPQAKVFRLNGKHLGQYLLDCVLLNATQQNCILKIEPATKDLYSYYLNWRQPLNYEIDKLSEFFGYFLYGNIDSITESNIGFLCNCSIKNILGYIVDNSQFDMNELKTELQNKNTLDEVKIYLQECVKMIIVDENYRNQINSMIERIVFPTPKLAVNYLKKLNGSQPSLNTFQNGDPLGLQPPPGIPNDRYVL